MQGPGQRSVERLLAANQQCRRYKEGEKNEEGAMIRVIVRLVIDGSINITFPRKQ